jgi:hypothetical protein
LLSNLNVSKCHLCHLVRGGYHGLLSIKKRGKQEEGVDCVPRPCGLRSDRACECRSAQTRGMPQSRQSEACLNRGNRWARDRAVSTIAEPALRIDAARLAVWMSSKLPSFRLPRNVRQESVLPGSHPVALNVRRCWCQFDIAILEVAGQPIQVSDTRLTAGLRLVRYSCKLIRKKALRRRDPPHVDGRPIARRSVLSAVPVSAASSVASWPATQSSWTDAAAPDRASAPHRDRTAPPRSAAFSSQLQVRRHATRRNLPASRRHVELVTI